MRDVIRSRQSPIGVLRETLASLGFGKKSAAHDSAEQWTAPTGWLSVTIQAARSGATPVRASHRMGNVQVFELPPGAMVGDRHLRLSPTEFSILLRLARAKGRLVGFAELSAPVNGGAPLSLRALNVHVHGLRCKLRLSSATARIMTSRALGYSLSAES
jgi:DNA-binding response OmpR family regulator